jgi:hypothetical protein
MLSFRARPRLEQMSVTVAPMANLPVEDDWDDLLGRCAT